MLIAMLLCGNMKENKIKEMKRNDIPGIIMRPSSLTEKENEKVMSSTKVSVSKGFYKAYAYHKGAMSIVAECAKIYIKKNWKKVKDWSNLSVVLEDANTLKGFLNSANGGKPLKDYVEYYNYTGPGRGWNVKSSVIKRMSKRIDKENKKKHNPIQTISDVVLDPTDGDFSLTINGRNHMWISDSTVIIIADYVEEQLAKKQKTKVH